MDNFAIARILREIADLLEIKNQNPFKIRAHYNGGNIVANHLHQLATLETASLRDIPGIGRDLAARIREITEMDDAVYHRELNTEFPATVLELLHLQGVGPKTVATLYRGLDIGTIDDLECAAIGGRLRSVRGMGARQEALILKALEVRRRHVGRRLLPDAHDLAAALVDFLHEHAPGADVEPVGSLRRGCDSCGDLDILAVGAKESLMSDFVSCRLVERVLARGETKSSVLLLGGFQADLRLVSPDSHGAALQYFTGSKAHNIALRDRASGLVLKLNEYGLFHTLDESRVAGAREEDVYTALGLDWIPPELREEIAAAAAHQLPRLVDRADLRGDLHTHSAETDGKDDVRTLAAAVREAGLEYLAITDHSQAQAMANGLDERLPLEHAARIRAFDIEIGDVRLLAGIECDIKPDGSLDLADDCLAALDLVVASVHSAFTQDRQQMTNRLLRAIENPHVHILGHQTGRLILKREPYPFDVETVIDAARRHGVALEINSQVDRLDLNYIHAKLARIRYTGSRPPAEAS